MFSCRFLEVSQSQGSSNETFYLIIVVVSRCFNGRFFRKNEPNKWRESGFCSKCSVNPPFYWDVHDSKWIISSLSQYSVRFFCVPVYRWKLPPRPLPQQQLQHLKAPPSSLPEPSTTTADGGWGGKTCFFSAQEMGRFWKLFEVL